MIHPCEIIYRTGANGATYGDTPGVCRITGKESAGMPFEKWVRKTFNDYDSLKPGTIISNEALFCFDEASEVIMKKTGRDKPQRFRTYSHIIDASGNWHCLTKADKPEIYKQIITGSELVCLTETGQKHILFKHHPGTWQLDDIHLTPDVETLTFLHSAMCDLMRMGFSQREIKTGGYLLSRIGLTDVQKWRETEHSIMGYRGSQIFDFTSFMLFIDEADKEKIQEKYDKKYKKPELPKPEKKTGENQNLTLW